MLRVLKLGAVTISLLSFSLQSLSAQNSAETKLPLQAEFLELIQAHKLSPGATVLARVTVDWNGPGCVLHSGAVLEATVTRAETRDSRGKSSLALSFARAQCNGTDLQPYPLVLVAAATPPNDYQAVPEIDINSPRLRAHAGGEPTAATDQPMFQTLGQRMEFTGVAHHFPLSPALRPGDVVGIRGLKLEIGTGPNRSSVFIADHKDLSLKVFTQILLNPPSVALIAAPNSKTAVESAQPVKAPEVTSVPTDTLEACRPPVCVIDPPLTHADLDARLSGSFALPPLGYRPRLRRLLADFEQDVALAWLAPDQLLFAFNSHPLVQRGIQAPQTTRVIHAVLLSVSSHAVLRSVDWTIQDPERFLWQLDSSRVLVHAADQLRIYSSGLQLERTIPLRGALRFVRISPDGASILIGTLRERHSKQLHARLREALGSEPEEDVEITVFDRTFQAVSTGVAASTLTPPTLLNEGQVALRPQPEGDYRISIVGSQNTSTTVARFRSTCVPSVSSISPDLLFLVSCVTNIGEPEYRVLHSDGTLILRGRPGLRQSGLESTGTARHFAVKFVSRSGDAPPGSRFSASDLDFVEIRVYRAEDGRRLAGLRVRSPATSYGGFALSPDDSQIAVLSGTEIRIFTVPRD